MRRKPLAAQRDQRRRAVDAADVEPFLDKMAGHGFAMSAANVEHAGTQRQKGDEAIQPPLLDGEVAAAIRVVVLRLPLVEGNDAIRVAVHAG